MSTRSAVVVLSAVILLCLPTVAEAALPTYTAVPIGSPDPQARSLFGQSILTTGDIDRDGVKDVIASSALTVNGVAGAGRVWVFSGRTREVLLRLDHPEPQTFSLFGGSIAGLGDVNADDVPDLAVGAPFQSVFMGSGTGCGEPEPNGCNESEGKVYVFSGRDGNLLYPVRNPSPQPNAFFGAIFSTATGDLNGDGVPDFVQPAPGEDVDGVPRAGAAYLLSGKDGSVIRRIPNPDPESFNFRETIFSMGVTNPGDVDGDGRDDLVIGFSGTTVNGNPNQGRAYLFSGSTGGILRTFDHPAPQADAFFGSMYSDPYAPGDVNADGTPDVLIDAWGQQVAGMAGAGQAYLFSGSDGSLLRTLSSPSPQAQSFFGFIFSRAGDLDGDQRGDLLIGQTGGSHPPAGSTGGAWVFDPRSGAVLADFTSIAPDAGQGLASPGDVNGDGIPDYFLSAPRADIGSNQDEGRAFAVLSNAPPPAAGPPSPPTPPPPPPAGPPGALPAPTGKFPAKLALARATINRGDRVLDVLVPITSRASGRVRVDLHAAGRHHRFTAPVNSRDGRIRFRKKIPRVQAELGTGIVSISYAGDADTRPQTVRLRAASQKAELEVRRPTIVDGRLRASGTVTDKARGVVRIHVQYDYLGKTRLLRFRAPIHDGTWALNAQLSANALTGIASRAGTLHSYTLFTGYFPRRIRGEMRSFQVLGDR